MKAWEDLISDAWSRMDLPYREKGPPPQGPRDAPLSGRADFEGIAPAAARSARVVYSRGVDRAPLGIPRATPDLERERTRWGEALMRCGIAPGTTVMVGLPNPDMADALLAAAAASGFRAVRLVPERFWGRIEEFGRVALVVPPLDALRLAQAGYLKGVRELLTTADTGGAVLARRLETACPDLRVREVYALTEYPGPVAVECSQGNLHWWRDDVAVEFLSLFQDRPASTGRDARVVLSGEAEAVPLVRYRTGDLARPLRECPCGEPGPVSEGGMLGRSEDAALTNDRLVTSRSLAEVLFGIDGVSDRFQAVLRRDRGRGRDLFELAVEALPGHDPEVVETALQDALALRLGYLARVRVRAAGDLEPARRIAVQDLRPHAGVEAIWR